MKTKHTPGPWSVRVDGGIDSPSKCIAHMSLVTSRQWPDQSRANAALIAASPDLLALAEQIVRRAESSEHMGHVLSDEADAARAAIAKAAQNPHLEPKNGDI